MAIEGATSSDVTIHHSQTSPGTLWGVTSLFHSGVSQLRLRNFQSFRRVSREQGLPLLAFEVTGRDRAFALTSDDADILIQIATDEVLWHKESVYNTCFRYLPASASEVCFLDADVVFSNPHWIEDTRASLDHADFVSPFETVFHLTDDESERLIREGRVDPATPGQRSFGFGLRETLAADRETFVRSGANPVGIGHTGFAIAMKREFMEAVGFYDRLVLGGGDMAIPDALLESSSHHLARYLPPSWQADLAQWKQSVMAGGYRSIGHVTGEVFHLWHGDKKYRFYGERYQITRRIGLNAPDDFVRDENGILSLKKGRYRQRLGLRFFFWVRNEEGGGMQRVVRFLLSTAAGLGRRLRR